MLRNENLSEFIGTLCQILQNTSEVETDKDKNTDRIILMQSVLGFIGNLCSDQQLRAKFASNVEGILDEVTSQFRKNVEQKPVLWEDITSRELAVLINVSVEANALKYLVEEKQLISILDQLISGLFYNKKAENN